MPVMRSAVDRMRVNVRFYRGVGDLSFEDARAHEQRRERRAQVVAHRRHEHFVQAQHTRQG